MTQPLTIANVRAIIQAHPVVFAALANSGAVGSEEVSLQIFDVFRRNPGVLDSVVAIGMGIEPAAAAKLGLLKHVNAITIVTQTAVALDATELLTAIAEELGALVAPGGMVLQ